MMWRRWAEYEPHRPLRPWLAGHRLSHRPETHQPGAAGGPAGRGRPRGRVAPSGRAAGVGALARPGPAGAVRAAAQAAGDAGDARPGRGRDAADRRHLAGAAVHRLQPPAPRPTGLHPDGRAAAAAGALPAMPAPVSARAVMDREQRTRRRPRRRRAGAPASSCAPGWRCRRPRLSRPAGSGRTGSPGDGLVCRPRRWGQRPWPGWPWPAGWRCWPCAAAPDSHPRPVTSDRPGRGAVDSRGGRPAHGRRSSRPWPAPCRLPSSSADGASASAADGLPPLNRGLTGYWRFDDGYGSNSARDLSVGGRDCRLHQLDPNGAWVKGALSGAIALDRGFVECPQATQAVRSTTPHVGLGLGEDRGLEPAARGGGRARQPWARATRTTSTCGMLEGKLKVRSDFWNVRVTARPRVPLGRWVHIAFTYEPGRDLRLYMDGKEMGRRQASASGARAMLVGPVFDRRRHRRRRTWASWPSSCRARSTRWRCTTGH